MPIRCSNETGVAGRPGDGLTVSRAGPPIDLALPAFFARLAFFRDAGRSGVFLATFFRIALILLTVFLRVVLLTRIFLRFALPFFTVVIAASLTLNCFYKSSFLPNTRISQQGAIAES